MNTIRKIDRVIREWLLPPEIYKWVKTASVKSHQAQLHFPHNAPLKKLLAQNKNGMEHYAGKRCFVIGNGPLLKNHDLSLLTKDDVTIVVNHFNRHPIAGEWQPTFHCVAEPIENIGDPKTEIPAMMAGLKPVAHFFRTEYQSLFNSLHDIDQTKIRYMHVRGSYYSYNNIDFTSVVLGSPNVSVMAVMLALWLRCSPIYLLGFNYDWLANDLHHHFYDEEKVTDMSKFLPSYLHRIRHADDHWAAHEKLNIIATSQNQKIFNGDRSSFLDVYPYARSITDISEGISKTSLS